MGNSDELQEPVLLPSPGRLLHEARVAKKLGVEKVADVLRLSPRVIQALEADDTGNLPAAAFVRGYLRAYAKMLGVSAEQVVDAYNQLNGIDQPDIKLKKSIKTQASSRDPRMRVATYLIVGVLSLLLAFWWYAERDLSGQSARFDTGLTPLPAGSQPAGDTVGSTEDASALAPEDAAVTDTLAQEAEPIPAQTETSADQAATAPAVVPGATRTAPVQEQKVAVPAAMETANARPGDAREGAVANTAETAAVQGDHLQLQVNGDSWIEVHDADGKRLVYDLVRGGKTVDIYGRMPFKVSLGNSVGVIVRLNGERFDHSAYNHGNLARFELGGAE